MSVGPRGGSSLPTERQGRAAPEALVARRLGLRAIDAIQLVDERATQRRCTIGGVSCLDVAHARPLRTLLYAHGGGFRMGEAATWGGFASRVAVAGELRMVVPDYRLAPEHPFPAALSDLARIYQELRADTNGPILVGGDSAGGGLALSLALLIRDEGQLRRPDGLVLISPWVDLIPANDTYTLLARVDQVFSREAALEAAEFYLQGAPADAALASPVRANLERIAPVQIFAGGSEVLLGDSLSLAGRLAISGVSVDARIVAGMQHVWTLSGPSLPETAMVVDEIARWCRARGSDENALKSETQDAM